MSPTEAEIALDAGLAFEERYLWEDASSTYQAAIAALDEGDAPDEPALARLLIRQGCADRNLGRWRPAWRALNRAYTLSRQVGAAPAMAQIAIEATQANAPWVRVAPLLEEALEALGNESPPLRGTLLALLTQWDAASTPSERFDEAVSLAEEYEIPVVRAVLSVSRRALADVLDDPSALSVAYGQAQMPMAAAGMLPAAAELGRVAGTQLLWAGRMRECTSVFEEGLEFASRHRLAYYRNVILLHLGMVAVSRGDLLWLGQIIDEMAGSEAVVFSYHPMTRAELAGDLDAARQLMPDPATGGNVGTFMCGVHGARARVLYHAGDHDAARRELAAWSNFFGPDLGPSAYGEIDVALAALADDATVARAYEVYTAREPQRFGGRGLDLIRGSLAARLGRSTDAERHFRTAMQWAEAEGLPFEGARARQALGALLAAGGAEADARHLLATALETFESLGIGFHAGECRSALDRLSAANP